MANKLWTGDELILAINLYCKIPFGQIHNTNPKIIELSKLLGRTPSSVSWKLSNFASFDPSLQARGIKGAVNASKLDKEIWNEFYNDWNSLPFESEKLLAKLEHTTIEKLNNIEENELPKEGKTREQIVKVRVNQSFFRSAILSSYNYTCCITGIQQPEFLIAGHIRPWGIDVKNRLNPQNGIAINSLHDKAFEVGLITITEDYKIKNSSILKKQAKNKSIQDYFLKYEDKSIILPSRFLPDIEFLKYHNQQKFRN
ncbi:MAG TPA: HNH endonuclease [Bacteroidia bacterium]|jgi:putative restriction endonuclease|nr:HNH endonuclease [Bacteroidia bacterium]